MSKLRLDNPRQILLGYLFLYFILFCTVIFLFGCNHEESKTEPTLVTDSVSITEEPDPVTLEITNEPIEANKTEQIETIVQELNKDIDNNGVIVDNPETYPDSIQGFRNNHYKEGDEVAYISAWGIWEAQTGTYNDHNCIIAQQGIEGPHGNFLGRVIIYYDYDENGLLEILNIEYVL